MNAAAARLIVALDLPEVSQIRTLVERLGDQIQWYKLGYEAFLTGGFGLVEELAAQGKSIFLDLKLHDIPETVRRAVAKIAEYPVGLTTLHVSDEKMLRQAASAKGKLRLLAVTVLTSVEGERAALKRLVVQRAQLAQACGCDGVVCSPLEARAVRAAVGQKMTIVTPGIRPQCDAQGIANDDQVRLCTPAGAIQDGADFLVVGRPIRDAADSRAAAEAILREIRATDGRQAGDAP